jgi:shikimate kinase
MPSIDARPIVLAGMMGSGKTTIGKALARATGRRYVDNDELVEHATGHSSKELFEHGGTPAVRGAEADALRAALSEPGDAVLGVAAGVVLDTRLRDALVDSGLPVVWLRAAPETLARRVLADHAGSGHRPWHAAGSMSPEEWLAQETERRSPLYAEIADLTVDVDRDGHDRSIEDIVADLIRGLGATPVG